MPKPVKIDSRKFLSAINESAQANVALYEEKVSQLGRSAGKSWKLASLNNKSLYIEDSQSNTYYVADHSKEHGKVTITNIRPLQIVEGEKEGLFAENCLKLVQAISENDQKGMQTVFDRMKAQRFSSRAVPHSGSVKCKDGVLRKINIVPESATFTESERRKLISTIVESLSDNVIVENGNIVGGTFNDGEPIKLPVTKWASRKLVAKRMLESAKNAYWSEGFQKRIYDISRLVAESKIEQAVHAVAPFLDEMEEFTLLNQNQWQELVENALAANAVFNQQLCEDTATLMFKTNMRISREKIVKEWRNIAVKTEHPVLAENVSVLADSRNFESSYQKFLSLIFEAVSNREITAEALATTLEVLKNKTPKIKESHDLSSKLDNLVARLKDSNLDDAAIYEAEDLIATIQEELTANDSLQDFDQMPGLGGGDAGLDVEAGSGTPVININSPLIQIGGSSSASGDQGEDDLSDLDMGEEMPSEEESLDDLLGAAPTQAPAAPAAAPAQAPAAPAAAPAFESRLKGRAVNESRPVHYEMKDENDDDMPGEEEEIEESNDPYSYNGGSVVEHTLLNDYGSPVISDRADLAKITNVMRRLAVTRRLTGEMLEHNLPSMAEASIKALGIRLHESKMPRAIEQAIELFNEESGKNPFPGAAPPFGKKSSVDNDGDGKFNWEDEDESEDDSEDEGMAEEQYHKPSIPQRGYKKASVQQLEEGIAWGTSQADAVLGEYRGVPFIFDHGGDNQALSPVILSEDGSVEIPIPANLVESAFAAANMASGSGEAFCQWLGGSIEQLRPITDDEDLSISEAMAKITTGPDGSISVEVSDDVEVNELGDDMDDMDDMGDMEDEGESEAEFDLDNDGETDVEVEMDDEMQPVDAVDVSVVDSEAGDEDEMPDFDDEESMDDDGSDESEDFGDESDEDEGLAEDNDITDPKSAKYAKHTKENLRDMPTPKLPKKSDDQLDKLGPTLKNDDGSGTKPPVARKGS
jgi:hypothetical protein